MMWQRQMCGRSATHTHTNTTHTGRHDVHGLSLCAVSPCMHACCCSCFSSPLLMRHAPCHATDGWTALHIPGSRLAHAHTHRMMHHVATHGSCKLGALCCSCSCDVLSCLRVLRCVPCTCVCCSCLCVCVFCVSCAVCLPCACVCLCVAHCWCVRVCLPCLVCLALCACVCLCLCLCLCLCVVCSCVACVLCVLCVLVLVCACACVCLCLCLSLCALCVVLVLYVFCSHAVQRIRRARA